jgi:hypothetical protein
MDLQYISDTNGRQTAVVIPIDDWHNLTAKHQDLKNLETPEKKTVRKKPSDFRGCITEESADKLLKYTEQARIEWQRDIF